MHERTNERTHARERITALIIFFILRESGG